MKAICAGSAMEPIIESNLNVATWREMALKAGLDLAKNLPDPGSPEAYDLLVRGYVRVTVEFVLPEEGETP